MNSVISFTKTKLPYGWLGNMSPYPLEFDGQRWLTSEALFQALRFTDPVIRSEIRYEKSPMAAKMKAKSWATSMVVVPRSLEDLSNMKMILQLKIDQHPSLRGQLLQTGEATIIEDVTNRRSDARFWGAALVDGQWVGHNVLGRIWMKIRTQEQERLAP